MGIMDDKIIMLENYIIKLNQAVENGDESEAGQLRHEIISVYEHEIDGIRSGLRAYDFSRSYSKSPLDNIGDAKVLRAKLENYKLNLRSGLYKRFMETDNSVNVIQNNQQEIHSNIAITLEQTISDINSLPKNILSDEEKEILCGKLATLSAEKNAKTRWEKAQGILKWVADKGIELGKVALPYVLEAIQNTTT